MISEMDEARNKAIAALVGAAYVLAKSRGNWQHAYLCRKSDLEDSKLTAAYDRYDDDHLALRDAMRTACDVFDLDVDDVDQAITRHHEGRLLSELPRSYEVVD